MSYTVDWMTAADSEKTQGPSTRELMGARVAQDDRSGAGQSARVRDDAGRVATAGQLEEFQNASGAEGRLYSDAEWEQERARRIYRARTVGMLRRYMRYSIETGRLPSLLGREFFRTQVTSYTVVTFEDRVIFVHDMERCLEKLDEFSRQVIARHVLQEHDQAATARLLNCSERTVRTYVPIALDVLTDILLEVGLLEGIESGRAKSCQGGFEDQFSVTACEDGKNKF